MSPQSQPDRRTDKTSLKKHIPISYQFMENTAVFLTAAFPK